MEKVQRLYKKKILEDPFTNLFKTELKSLKYLKKNDKIIVSASGGLDSTVLLVLLHSINIHKILNLVRPPSAGDS